MIGRGTSFFRLLSFPVALAALALSLRIGAAMIGLLPPVNAHLPALPNDALLGRALLHVLYGFAGFFFVLLTGLCFTSLFGLKARLRDTDMLAFALPLGLVVCLLVCILATAVPIGATVAVVAVVLVIAVRFRQAANALRTIVLPRRRLALVALAVATLAAHAAIMSRPPAAGFGGTADPGDLIVYLGYFETLSERLYPFAYLGVEGEPAALYFNQMPTLLAIGMSWLPRFEAAMLLAAGSVVFFALSLCYSLAVLIRLRQQKGAEVLSTPTIALIAILMLAAIRYPSWVVESPPAAFMSAFAFALVYAVHRSGKNPAALIGMIGFGTVASILTKVVSLPVFVTYSGMALLVRCFRQLRPATMLLLLGAGAVVGAYALFMLSHYGPGFFPRVEFGPETWLRFQEKGWEKIDKVFPYLMRDLGMALIVIGAFLLRDAPLAFAVAVGVVCQYTVSFLFHATPMAAITLLAGMLVLKSRPPKVAFWTILVGAIMVVEHHVDRDPGKWHFGVIWILALGSAVWLSLTAAAWPAGTGGARAVRFAWAGLCVLAVTSIAGAASNVLRLGDDNRYVVQPALVDIWQKTRSMTPTESLVFTDQTGFDSRRLTGWNDLSLLSRRQFYISTTQSSRLRHDDDARRRHLQRNADVLSGAAQPAELDLTRPYDGFYAVTAHDHQAPPTFSLVYRNEGYALYRIGGEQAAP